MSDRQIINGWVIPVVGDTMQTPSGDVIVTHVTKYSWSGKSDTTGCVNIPFWEGRNWEIFKVKTN